MSNLKQVHAEYLRKAREVTDPKLKAWLLDSAIEARRQVKQGAKKFVTNSYMEFNKK